MINCRPNYLKNLGSKYFWLWIGVSWLAACTPTPSLPATPLPSPTSVAAFPPTVTVPTPTDIPTPTGTPIPTNTPTTMPTATSLPTPLPPPSELRGVWVHLNDVKSPADVDRVIEQAAAAHLNTLFVNAYLYSFAYYNSQVAQRAEDLPVGFDPMADLIPKAHARGMQVHAWFTIGQLAYSLAAPGPVLTAHPDWAMMDACGTPGRWLNYAKSEARQFIVDLISEMARNYDVDGIHLDYIRYADPVWSFDPDSAAGFAQKYQAPLEAVRQPELPAWGYFTGNLLTSPTTAQVLATFDSDQPALTINQYGQGQVILFNWDVSRGCPVGAVHEIMRRSLQLLAGDNGPVSVLQAEGVNKSGPVAFIQLWLRNLGREAGVIDAAAVAGLPPGSVVVLPNVYAVPADLAADLADYVDRGGNLIFIDGPASTDSNIQKITGMKEVSESLYRELLQLNPVGPSPLLPVGPPTWTEELDQQWAEYRRDTVTQLVKEIHQALLAMPDSPPLSAAVYPSQAAAEMVSQDWTNWLAAGDLDLVIPMAYVTEQAELMPLLVEWQTLPKFNQVIPGLIVYVEDTEENKPPQQLLDEINILHGGGARGVVLFDLEHFDEALNQALATGPFATQ